MSWNSIMIPSSGFATGVYVLIVISLLLMATTIIGTGKLVRSVQRMDRVATTALSSSSFRRFQQGSRLVQWTCTLIGLVGGPLWLWLSFGDPDKFNSSLLLLFGVVLPIWIAASQAADGFEVCAVHLDKVVDVQEEISGREGHSQEAMRASEERGVGMETSRSRMTKGRFRLHCWSLLAIPVLMAWAGWLTEPGKEPVRPEPRLPMGIAVLAISAFFLFAAPVALKLVFRRQRKDPERSKLDLDGTLLFTGIGGAAAVAVLCFATIRSLGGSSVELYAWAAASFTVQLLWYWKYRHVLK